MTTSMKISVQHLDFIVNHSQKTMIHLNELKNLNSIQYFCVGLLERLANASSALNILLQNVETNHSLEYSCGIILRSALLDILMVFNLYNIITDDVKYPTEEDKKQAAQEFCDIILTDGLENTLKYLKVAKDVNMITEQQLSDTYRNFVAARSRFFEPYAEDGSKPVLKINKYFSSADLFKKIATNPEFKELSKVYDSYLFFSKYDHFGILYYEVSRQNFDEQLERIAKGIELFIGALLMLHVALHLYSENDEFLDAQSGGAAKYLYTEIIKQEA